MIDLSRVRRGMGCASCNGSCGGCNKGIGRLRRTSLGVMVCCDDEGNLYDDGTSSSPTDVTGGVTPDCAYGGIWPNCISPSTVTSPALPTVTYTPPASSSTSALTLAGQIAQAAGTAAAPIVKLASQQAPYYVTNPATGQSVLYNPNTGAVASGVTNTGISSIFGTGATTSSLTPLLLLAGIAAVVMMSERH